jgi:hypothetical protein
MPPTTDLIAVLGQLIKLPAPKLDLKKTSAASFETKVDAFGEAAAPAKRDIRKAFGTSLVPIAGDNGGGVFAEWRATSGGRPIVYFGSEGNVEVAAHDLRELLGLLAYSDREGWSLKDAMGHWRDELTTLDADRIARDKQREENGLPGPVVLSSPCAAIDARISAVLAPHDIPIPPDLLATVEAANGKHLWDLIDTLDVFVTGQKVFRLWFDAWSRDEGARKFSPQEHYDVGEKVHYVSKMSWGEVVGRGLVIGNPAPNRVLLADQHNTFARACAET